MHFAIGRNPRGPQQVSKVAGIYGDRALMHSDIGGRSSHECSDGECVTR
jgi:hypothetical protein